MEDGPSPAQAGALGAAAGARRGVLGVAWGSVHLEPSFLKSQPPVGVWPPGLSGKDLAPCP